MIVCGMRIEKTDLFAIQTNEMWFVDVLYWAQSKRMSCLDPRDQVLKSNFLSNLKVAPSCLIGMQLLISCWVLATSHISLLCHIRNIWLQEKWWVPDQHACSSYSYNLNISSSPVSELAIFRVMPRPESWLLKMNNVLLPPPEIWS